MTAGTYDKLVRLDKFQQFDLPLRYNFIDPECRHEVDKRSPREFYVWCASLILAGEPMPILLDVPF